MQNWTAVSWYAACVCYAVRLAPSHSAPAARHKLWLLHSGGTSCNLAAQLLHARQTAISHDHCSAAAMSAYRSCSSLQAADQLGVWQGCVWHTHMHTLPLCVSSAARPASLPASPVAVVEDGGAHVLARRGLACTATEHAAVSMLAHVPGGKGHCCKGSPGAAAGLVGRHHATRNNLPPPQQRGPPGAAETASTHQPRRRGAQRCRRAPAARRLLHPASPAPPAAPRVCAAAAACPPARACGQCGGRQQVESTSDGGVAGAAGRPPSAKGQRCTTSGRTSYSLYCRQL